MSGNLDLSRGEKMAIPVEGDGHDQMDVSTEDSPSYVDITMKGPGKPIRIRSHDLDVIASQFNNGNVSGPVKSNAQCSEYGIGGNIDSFLDKKTGSALTFGNNVVDVENAEDTEYKESQDETRTDKLESSKSDSLLDISEGNRAQLDNSRFRSQSMVVSIGNNSNLDELEILTTPKKKYQLRQNGSKKNIGTKKNSPGKIDSSLKLVERQAPYPKWMNLPLKDILGKPFFDKDGNMCQWELQLVPVESDVTSKENDSMQMANNQNSENGISEGSIDRPPDDAMNLGDNHNPTEAVNAVAHTQPSTTNHNYVGSDKPRQSNQDVSRGAIYAPNIYDNDQPLDLTIVKPLDLSMKNRSENEVRDFHRDQEDEEVDHVMGNIEGTVTAAESNINDYRTQCSSVMSNFERESLQGDETYDSLTDNCTRQNDQQNVAESDLPSLGKLTLESNIQARNLAVVQDSLEQKAMISNVGCQDNAVIGHQNVLNLFANFPTALLSQLANLSKMNQLQLQQSQIAVPQAANQLQLPQSQLAIPQAAEKLDIPAPAIPNLCSLELANNEGEILVKEEEAMKNKLKAKILQRRHEGQ